jgi:hypothetical protein
MRRVVFTSDVFRSAGFGLPSVSSNRSWLRGLFHNLFVSSGYSLSEFAPASEGGTFDVDGYRSILGLPMTVDGWAVATATHIPEDAKSLFNGLIDSDVVIGWGLTPAVINLLNASQITFIDVEIDPIRFANDLFFRMRTNNKQISRLLKELHVSSEDLRLSVADIRGYVSRRAPEALREGSSLGLFVGQTTTDLSIIASGRIAEPKDYIEEIRQIAERVDILLVKPHPGQAAYSHLSSILDGIPNTHLCNSNIYRILSDINIRHVIGLSSSVLHEARQFGIPTTQLISCDRDESSLVPTIAKNWYRVTAQIVAERNLTRACRKSFYLPPIIRRRNRDAHEAFDLRRNLGGGWGLDEFYSNVSLSLDLPHRAANAHCRQRLTSYELGPYLSKGWSAPEGWGCWSEGRRHLIEFHLSDFSRWKSATATLHLVGFVPLNHSRQQVRIYLDGKLVTDWVLQHGDMDSARISIAISSPDVTIIIETPDAKSPVDLGLNSDERELGVGLVSISFAPGITKADFALM